MNIKNLKINRLNIKKINIKLILSLLIMSLFLFSCALPGGHTNPDSGIASQYAKYYTGTQGVIATFDELPNQLFYYNEPENAYNDFEVSVKVHNDGASFARGGIYLSGYDPDIIQFEEAPVGKGSMGSCGLSISSLGFGSLGGIFSCDGLNLGVSGGGNYFFNVDSISNLVNGINTKFGKSWWVPKNFDIGVNTQKIGDQSQFNFQVKGINDRARLEYLGHGRLFIALFAGVDFTRTNGIEYLLAGDTYDYPGGEDDYLLYHGHILQTGWPPGLDELPVDLMLTNCYFYTTYAAPLVCIDPNPHSGKNKICNPVALSWSGSQGAPVAITSVKEDATPRKAVFHINIANLGRGTVFDPGKLEKCSPYMNQRLRTEDKNIVYLGDIRIGMTRLTDCVPDGIIRLNSQGKGTITCTYPYDYGTITSGYTAPLIIELWYGYSETQQRKIMIKRGS